MGDDEVQVRAAAERLVAAFGSGRLDDYFACFADDATFVFYTTPQRLESVDAYRQLWDRWVREDGFRVTGCVSSAVRVQVLGDAAVMVHDVVTDVETRVGAETLTLTDGSAPRIGRGLGGPQVGSEDFVADSGRGHAT